MLSQSNSATNISNSTTRLPIEYCRRFQEEDYFELNYAVTLASIILNILCFPVTILMNSLVIVAIKSRQRLHHMNNVLLACLAGTDLLVGTVAQPTYIATEIFGIADGSVNTYCNIFENIFRPFIYLSIFPSLFHLALISIERYIALKYALRYHIIVTKPRLAFGVGFSWFVPLLYTLFRLLKVNPRAADALRVILAIFCLSVIVFCHISVYFITRRHEKQISTEQISEEAATKFLEERKAWKTTSIIIGFVFLSFSVAVAGNLALVFGSVSKESPESYFLLNITFSSIMLNSLCNPIIYCWRSKKIRKAMIAVIRRGNQN